MQWAFDTQWRELRAHAHARGVALMGDAPIFVALDSADVWAHPELFELDAHGRPAGVAGVPPDYFSATGQLWGNPLYDWPAVRRRGYRWWVERTRRTLSLFDVARIDHFRGFVAYWAVPEGAANAIAGSWKRGPGRAVFDAIDRELGLPFVAEDLGKITPPVEHLRDELGLPGMLVLQFGFEPDEPRSVHRMANHAEFRFVYTGTHDHDTARGFVESLDPARRAVFEAELAERAIVENREPWWALIRLAMSSPARVAMLQAQDVLGLGSEAQMNRPGTARGNWRWKLRRGQLTGDLAERLRDATVTASRGATRR